MANWQQTANPAGKYRRSSQPTAVIGRWNFQRPAILERCNLSSVQQFHDDLIELPLEWK